MEETKFNKLQYNISKLITTTYNKATLRRGLTSKAAKVHLAKLNTQLNNSLSNKNLTRLQYLELQNFINDKRLQYTDSVTEKTNLAGKNGKLWQKEQIKLKQIEADKIKTEQLKQHQQSKARITVLKPNISDTSRQNLTSLIKSAESMSGVKPSNVVVGSSSKEVVPYEIAKAKGNRLNFNLKGYSLFENSAYNAKIHGVANTIQELDEGIRNKKISVSEANQIKSTLTDKGVSHKLNQLGTDDQVKQFNRPEYQKAFKGFLTKAFSKYMRVIPVVGPVFQLKEMKKQYEQVMEGTHPMFPSAEKFSQQVFKKGGKVKPKPKPYAMGGKVYSNTIRKPKLI